MLIPRPPSEALAHTATGSQFSQVTQETNYVFPIRKIVCGGKEYAYFNWETIKGKIPDYPEFEGLQMFEIKTGEEVPSEGQFVYHQGLLYPHKGFVYPEVLIAVNTVKRYTISLISSLATKELILPILAFLILPWFIKRKILHNFLYHYKRFNYLILAPYLLAENYRMTCAKELEKWLGLFLENLKLKTWPSRAIAEIIETDSAYTLRFQDIMSEVDKEALLRNPSKELTRLFKIFVSREKRPHLQARINSIVLGLRLLFFIPRIRKAFVKATAEIDFSKLGLSEADRYHCLFLSGYEFMGRTADDRWAELEKLHDGKVPRGEFVVGSTQP